MKRSRILAVCTLILVAVSSQTVLASMPAHPTHDLNLRSGPSTRFPAVVVLRRGSTVTVHGCVKNYTWCDVSAGRYRGWASGAYLDVAYSGRYYRVPISAERVGIPVISFEIDTYWGQYYDEYDFYADLDRWDDYQWYDEGLPPGWGDWDTGGVNITVHEPYDDGGDALIEEPAECFLEAPDGSRIPLNGDECPIEFGTPLD